MLNSRTRHGRGWGSSRAAYRHHTTMIELETRMAAIRRSKIAFWAVGSTVGLTTGVIASAITSGFNAIAIGLITGLVMGLVVAVVLFIWPAIRMAWHWAAEMLTLASFLAGYLLLNRVLPWCAALTVLTTPVLLAFAIPRTRRL